MTPKATPRTTHANPRKNVKVVEVYSYARNANEFIAFDHDWLDEHCPMTTCHTVKKLSCDRLYRITIERIPTKGRKR